MKRRTRHWRRKSLALTVNRWNHLDPHWLKGCELPTARIVRTFSPGWYLLGLRLEGPQHRYRMAVSRGQEPFRQVVWATNGIERRRLIRLRHPATCLAVTLQNLDGDLDQLNVRIKPLFSPRALYLVGRLLRVRHGHYQRRVGSNRALSHQRRWRHYNQLHERRSKDSFGGYGQWMERVEKPHLLDARLASAREKRREPTLTPLKIQLWPERSAKDSRELQADQLHGPWALATTDEPRGWVLVLDRNDHLAHQALRRWSLAAHDHPTAELIYADSDLVSEQGRRHSPQFKPAWNPELLLSDPHYSRSYWVRHDRFNQARTILESLGEPISPYGLLLVLAHLCTCESVVHVPEVLVHHPDEAILPRGSDDSAALVERILGQQGHRVTVQPRSLGGHRLQWPLPRPAPLVSLIIPTRDRQELLQGCLDSLAAHPEEDLELETIIVDNGSVEPTTLAYLQQLEDSDQARVLRSPGPFNFSRHNNEAAAVARGELLLLLNNDVEVAKAGWLSEMVSQALRPEIGCVGAQLLFPDGTVQHGGVFLGIGGVAGHGHKYFHGGLQGYQMRLQLTQNVSAVTAATLVIRRDLFMTVGGFDAETFAVNYNDVDLCLRVLAAGFRNVYCPDAVLVHHESKSRGAPTTPAAYTLWQRERRAMQERWGSLLETDLHYSPHLSLVDENFSLALRTGGFTSRIGNVMFRRNC